MGTSLDAAVIASPSVTAAEVAGALLAIGASAPPKPKVIASVSQARFGGLTLSWCTLVGPPAHSLHMSLAAAQQLSLPFVRSLSVAFSDSLGECDTTLFERGEAVGHASVPEPPGSIRAAFAAAFAHAFPGCGIVEPEAALESLWAPEASSTSFIIARHGVSLAAPELYPKGT